MMRKRSVSKWYLLLLGFSCLMSIVAGAHIFCVKAITVLDKHAVLLACISLCLSILWRWRSVPQSCRPPWKRSIRRVVGGRTLSFRTRLWMRWQFACLWFQQHTYRPLPLPRPVKRNPQRTETLATLLFTDRPTKPSRAPFRIHFVASDEVPGSDTAPEHVQHGLNAVQLAFAQAISHPPALLALHVQPHKICCQYAQTPLLSEREQCNVVQHLQQQGYRAKWSAIAWLRLSQTPLMSVHCPLDKVTTTIRWMPVLQNRRDVVWWPLTHNQHVVFAGAVASTLTALVRRLQQSPEAERSHLLVHDPDAYLRTLDDIFAETPHDMNALAKARQFQLARQYALAQGNTPSREQTPLCVVVAPDEAIWSDLQPLLAPDSGVQVLLVLANHKPIAPLRVVCHHLWVIEAPTLHHAALPDAFRPSGVTAARHGHVVAWSPGGGTVWHGSSLDKPQAA